MDSASYPFFVLMKEIHGGAGGGRYRLRRAQMGEWVMGIPMVNQKTAQFHIAILKIFFLGFFRSEAHKGPGR